MITNPERLGFLAQNIRDRLELLGWTQEELEQKSGVTQATISKLLNAKVDTRITAVWSIAEALGTSIDKMLQEPAKKILQKSS